MTIIIGEDVVVEVEIPPTMILAIEVPQTPSVTVIYPMPYVVIIEELPVPEVYIPALPGPRGDQGLPGSQGLQGIPGLSSIELISYNHLQPMPSETWVIEHPLSFNPVVTVIDSAGSVVYGDVSYSGQTVTITFSSGFSGTAYLS